MLKKIALAAFAAVSVSAFAQEDWYESLNPSNKTWWQSREMVIDRAEESLSAGDAYKLVNVLDHSPAHVTIALVNSMAHNYYQARMIGYEIALARVPVSSSSYTTTVTNPDGTVTSTTTTTSTNYTTMYADSMRPMRLVMEVDKNDREINYDRALDILTSNLNGSEATNMRSWWRDKATEHEKDVIVRYLSSNTRFADWTIYPSTIRRTTYIAPAG